MPITNTLEVTRRLTQAGVPSPQAEALSELFESTAQDAVREMKTIVAQEGERIRTEVRAEIQAVRLDMQSQMKDLELRIAERLRFQMIWYVGTQIALIGAAAGIAKLLFG
jgi:hypothetical protein